MDVDSTINADNKQQLQVEGTDDSCIVDFIEILPLTRDTDVSSATESVSEDWFAEVKQENLTVLEEEPGDVCRVFMLLSVYCSKKNFYLKFIILY